MLIHTGKVGFLDQENRAQELTAIPPVVFSEVMRGVDLFAGVTSIGLDPAWNQRAVSRLLERILVR